MNNYLGGSKMGKMGGGQSTMSEGGSDSSTLQSPGQLLEARKSEQLQTGIEKGTDAYSQTQRYMDQGNQSQQSPQGAPGTLHTTTEIQSSPGLKAGETVHQARDLTVVVGSSLPLGERTSDRYVVDQRERDGSVTRILMEHVDTSPFPTPPGAPSAVPVASIHKTTDRGGLTIIQGAQYDRRSGDPLERVPVPEKKHTETGPYSDTQTVRKCSDGSTSSATFNPSVDFKF